MSRRAVVVVAALAVVAALVAWRFRPGGALHGAAASAPAAAHAAAAPARASSSSSSALPAAVVQRASPASALTGARATLASAAWGSGAGQLGRSRPQEGNPEGPASLAVDREGRLLVLDRVNGRIARFDRDGRPLPPLLTTQRSPQELLVAPDGSLLVMDRLADRSVAILDADGKLKGELPIVGRGLDQGGSATGLFVDATGVYVENEHSQLVRIGDLQGQADPERTPLDGRPSRDGRSLLSAGVIDPAAGRFWVRALDRATGALRWQRAVVLPLPYLALVFLDSDPSGGIYVAAHVGREVEPGALRDEAIQVVCLSPEAQVRGVATLPASTMPEETFRELAVQDDGTIVHLERTEAGVAVRTYRCQ